MRATGRSAFGPAATCYGWLSLDRRGCWRLRGEPVTHGGLNAFLNQHYACDADGNYYVQNGPQRVFVDLAYTPWIVHLAADHNLASHVGRPVSTLLGAALDEEGSLLVETREGIALLCDRDLPTLLDHVRQGNGKTADEDVLLALIAQTGTSTTALTLAWEGASLPLHAVRRSQVPERYGFVASPRALAAAARW